LGYCGLAGIGGDSLIKIFLPPYCYREGLWSSTEEQVGGAQAGLNRGSLIKLLTGIQSPPFLPHHLTAFLILDTPTGNGSAVTLEYGVLLLRRTVLRVVRTRSTLERLRFCATTRLLAF